MTPFLLALFVPPAATAQTLDARFDLTDLHQFDGSFDLFSNSNALAAIGTRWSATVHERVAVVAGWHHSRTGLDLYGDDDFAEPEVRTALFSNRYTLGLRADVPVADVFFPNVSLEAALYHGIARFDDDPEVSNSPGQTTRVGVAPGGVLTGGFQVRVPMDGWLHPAFHFDLGYAMYSGAPLQDVGTLRPSGFLARGGFGLVVAPPNRSVPAPQPPVEEGGTEESEHR